MRGNDITFNVDQKIIEFSQANCDGTHSLMKVDFYKDEEIIIDHDK